MMWIPVLLVGLAEGLSAAPKLRLATAAVGPVSVTQGANASVQTVEAYNAGDGNLSLQTAASAPWLSAAVGGSRPCSNRPGDCLPVNISFNTTSLAKGMYTGLVTVSDPNALDAPQNISVTVQIGGGVPDSMNFYVAPNGAPDTLTITTNSLLTTNTSTQSGGPWLSVALTGTGSFRFTYPYKITAAYQDGMAEGTYTGSLQIAGSNVAVENKTVPVRLQVTSQPITRISPSQLAFRIAGGAPVQQAYLSVTNGGLGTLSVSTITVETASGGNWLAADSNAGLVTVKADVTGMNTGSYAGTVKIAANGVNGGISVPVTLDVVAQGPPFAVFGGVLNSGNFDNGFAPGSVAALFGERLSMKDAASATAIPLGTNINGVRVLVNDQPAPLYYASYGQVNFQIPYEIDPGEAVVRVERDGQGGNRLGVTILDRAPLIIQVGNNGVVVNPDGSLAIAGGRPARPGEAVTIYCVGLGRTNPAASTGAAAPGAEPLARISPAPRVSFGNVFSGLVSVDALYVGLTPSLVGLYQVNVILPSDLPDGDVNLSLAGDGYQSNIVHLPVKR
ncbi:MAG: hypothetical protein IT167_27015 [Bryobacterales bacterium]|nr:hypothetical protein [Bryobacterales bacterium]